MSGRRTGVTPEQIEAAAKLADDSWVYGEGMPHVLGPEVRTAAPFLVRPDQRIVDVADLRALLDALPGEGNWVGEIVSDDLRDRITALIGGEA